jgi:hypothetical protein
MGRETLFSNTTGSGNTAIGTAVLSRNTTASNNTATGTASLFSNTTGEGNCATGRSALLNNTEGGDNTASGFRSLENNTTAFSNTASGGRALLSNTTGGNNTASGADALSNNTTGSTNIAIGRGAGSNLTTGSNNIDIAALGVAGESNTIRIGALGTQKSTFIQGISGATVPSGAQVMVGSGGKLGTLVSSARYKEEIKPMEDASESLLALKPVTFKYKKDLDPEAIPQFGLVAEEVEKVNPDLVGRDGDGKVYTVRYEAVNAMLLNEFLKEHRKVEQLQEQIDALKAGLQKVSQELEVRTAQPQVAANSR